MAPRKPRFSKIAAEEFTFGVEIECGIPVQAFLDNNLIVGGYHRGAPQQAFESVGLHGWLIQHDGSLSFRGPVRPLEISSPILRGAEGVAQVLQMLALIKSWGGKVNISCGVHVTVGHEAFKSSYNQCQLLLSMYRFSDAMVAVGASFGRRNRHYAASLLTKYGTHRNRKQMGDECFANVYKMDRYQSLNIRNSGEGRVEFRLFAGTLNPSRMLAAIWTSIAICQYALTVSRLEKAVIGLADYANASYYQKNLDCMMWLLGWTERKSGKFFSEALGVMGDPDGVHFPKVLAQVRKDAKRMDAANAEIGFRARVPRPENRRGRRAESN